jgi:hypothetical protein
MWRKLVASGPQPRVLPVIRIPEQLARHVSSSTPLHCRAIPIGRAAPSTEFRARTCAAWSYGNNLITNNVLSIYS